MTTCPICGIELREGDSVVEVDDRVLHHDCAAPHEASVARRIGTWGAYGSRGQMAIGDAQRGP